MFERRVLSQPPAWDASTTRVDGRGLRVKQRTKIEDVGEGVVEVNFANKMVGGSVMSGNSVTQVTDISFISERELKFRFAICRRPSVCLSSVTFVRPTQAIGNNFGNVFTPFGTLAIRDLCVKILRRSSQWNPSIWG